MPKKVKTESPSPSPPPIIPPTPASPPPPTADSTRPTTPLDDAEWHAKNARAKAIIMSTLIPGSEPWQIAEPLNLASDIWKALEDRYAPKQSASPANPRSSLDLLRPSERSDFVSEWVDGKSLEKYRVGTRPGQVLTNFPADALMPEYNLKLGAEERELAKRKRDQEAAAMSADAQREAKAATPTQAPSDTTPKANGLKRVPAEKQPPLTKQAQTEPKPQPQPSQVAPGAATAEGEEQRKEAQRAAARVLREHMPNRDQRFLWAVLHGGKAETTAWFNGTAGGGSTQ